jgi:hypothetical protein
MRRLSQSRRPSIIRRTAEKDSKHRQSLRRSLNSLTIKNPSSNPLIFQGEEVQILAQEGIQRITMKVIGNQKSNT